MSVLVLQKAEDDSRQDGKDGVVAGGGGSGGGWRGGRAAVLVEPQSQQQARARGRPSLGDASELIATASTALRRLHFKSGTGFRRRTSSTPAPKVIVMGGSLESQNTSTDSSNTVITMVTVDDSCEQEHHHEEMRITPNLLEDMVGLGEDEAMHLEHTSLPHQGHPPLAFHPCPQIPGKRALARLAPLEEARSLLERYPRGHRLFSQRGGFKGMNCRDGPENKLYLLNEQDIRSQKDGKLNVPVFVERVSALGRHLQLERLRVITDIQV
ncbi:hypothetical protein AAG570_007325 [Ranatra chinensis]|uniref:Uncharacterized protein n=1 Tax=Ranatra chinensis TaxID=642074 RepID=A0ABD0YE31_9HEMI